MFAFAGCRAVLSIHPSSASTDGLPSPLTCKVAEAGMLATLSAERPKSGVSHASFGLPCSSSQSRCRGPSESLGWALGGVSRQPSTVGLRSAPEEDINSCELACTAADVAMSASLPALHAVRCTPLVSLLICERSWIFFSGFLMGKLAVATSAAVQANSQESMSSSGVYQRSSPCAARPSCPC